MGLLAVVLWLVLEVFRCNGVAGCGVLVGVDVKTYSCCVSVTFSHCQNSKNLKTCSDTTFRSKTSQTQQSGYNKYVSG